MSTSLNFGRLSCLYRAECAEIDRWLAGRRAGSGLVRMLVPILEGPAKCSTHVPGHFLETFGIQAPLISSRREALACL